ncbi:MAG TPA: hypothetical protein DIV39_00305, partial [Verrucomicrobiales bacterium]|nr:hypothetical protein [Verrucomicrobiales bacterium]
PRLSGRIMEQPFRLVPVFAALLLGAVTSLADESDVIQRELGRRAQATQQAQQALLAGDKAYRLADYATAVTEFAKAFGLFPGGDATADLKLAAGERFAQASVERARELARVGDYPAAEALLENVLDPGVAPRHAGAKEMMAQLGDPIRNNPALTPEHAEKVQEVRRYLAEAQGFKELGQYDRAMVVYGQVLTIDPHNSAARRGMEGLHAHKVRYSEAARDQARGQLLSDVGKAWASPIPKGISGLADANFGALRDGARFGASASEKLDSMIIPVVDMDQVLLGEAIDFLRQQAAALDLDELDPSRKGIAFVIQLGNADALRARTIETTPFSLKLRNVPMRKVLDLILEATRTQARIDDYAVVIRPAGVISDELVFRQFKMPPDFLSREDLAGDAGGAEADPFAGNEAPQRGLVKRLSAQDYLKQKGVNFPPGASALYRTQSSILSVKNTETNMALVEVIVDAIVDAEPVMIIVEARIIRSTEQRLDELGFDWLLDGPQALTDELLIHGGTVGNGTPTAAAPFRPITAGNRSGNLATDTNSIDGAIARTSVGNTQLRAPGSIFATGIANNATVGMLMRGVGQHKGIDLMTKKTVITRSGQSATIESVREFIYPTEYEPPELPNQVGGNFGLDADGGLFQEAAGITPVTPAHPTAFETTNLGCMLEVLPQLGSDGIIEVSIKPEIRDFDGFINYGTPILGGTSSSVFDPTGGVLSGGSFGVLTENAILMPVFSTIRGNSTLSIYQGETVVLGGLLTSSQIGVEDQVPILSKIPLIGRYFKSQAQTSMKDAYVIMVSVRLEDPSGQPVSR